MALAMWGLASGCTLETPGIEHPLPDSLASAFHPGLVADVQEAPVWVNLETGPDSLVAAFGARETPEAGLIGRIAMAQLRGDEIFVLDDQLNVVHVLNIPARTHVRVGRPGQGPGELAFPRGLALSEDRIFVADERQMIHVFDRMEGEWSWTRDVPVPFFPMDACFMDDGLYLLALRDEASGFIHRLEQDEVVASFGISYRWDNPIVRDATTEGRLACLPEIGGIAWVPTRLNEVHMYGTDGVLRWIARLPDHRPMGIVENAESGSVAMGLTPGRSEMHMLYAVAPVASHLLVQLSLYDQEAVDADAPKAIHSYVIDPTSGAVGEIDFPYPGLIDWHGGRMALFANDPWPKVDVIAVSERSAK
ncbi:MAG: 6-bladed beta-propeller [Gammaproteobacteria bacterium]|nr:6-bladed beta-propeller [Gammaproteobacteria bacterium]MDE0260233.1 6-bladed beta-propeller [Gammaproteobacteria bacterium]